MLSTNNVTVEYIEKRFRQWKPFQEEESNEIEERERMTIENEESFLVQLQRCQFAEIVNLLDSASRARLMKTCKALNTLCHTRRIHPLELPLRLEVTWDDGWKVAGWCVTSTGKKTDLTRDREQLIESVKVKLDMISIEWKNEGWLSIPELDQILTTWNVTSSDSLTLKILGRGPRHHWREQEYELAEHLVTKFDVKHLTLENVRVVGSAIFPVVPHLTIG